MSRWKRASKEFEKEIDDALGIQLISFRLKKEIIKAVEEAAIREDIIPVAKYRRIIEAWAKDNEK